MPIQFKSTLSNIKTKLQYLKCLDSRLEAKFYAKVVDINQTHTVKTAHWPYRFQESMVNWHFRIVSISMLEQIDFQEKINILVMVVIKRSMLWNQRRWIQVLEFWLLILLGIILVGKIKKLYNIQSHLHFENIWVRQSMLKIKWKLKKGKTKCKILIQRMPTIMTYMD